MRKWPVVLACLLTVCGNAAAQDGCSDRFVSFAPGFITGQECLGLVETGNLKDYMVGFVNGLSVSTFVGAPFSCLKPFQECLVGRSDTQLAAVLEKWLRENPSHWHEPCNVLTWLAISDMCDIE